MAGDVTLSRVVVVVVVISEADVGLCPLQVWMTSILGMRRKCCCERGMYNAAQRAVWYCDRTSICATQVFAWRVLVGVGDGVVFCWVE